jgi:hypothetical protein
VEALAWALEACTSKLVHFLRAYSIQLGSLRSPLRMRGLDFAGFGLTPDSWMEPTQTCKTIRAMQARIVMLIHSAANGTSKVEPANRPKKIRTMS